MSYHVCPQREGCSSYGEYKALNTTSCGGFQMQCINPYKGYQIYQKKCCCNPQNGQYEVYIKYASPLSHMPIQGHQACANSYHRRREAQCCHGHRVHRRKRLFGLIF